MLFGMEGRVTPASDVALSSGPDERYRRLIERSQVGLFQTGLDGSVRWVNEAAADIVGFDSPEQFLAELGDIRDIYVDPARRDDFLREVEANGRVVGFEYEIRRRDGSNRWISVSATTMQDAAGNVEGLEGTVVDITEAKLIQAAAEAISSELEPQESVSRFAQVLNRVVPFQQISLGIINGDHYRRLVSISTREGFGELPAGEWVPLEGNSVSAVIASKKPLVVDDTEAGEWEFDRRLHEAGVGSYAIFPLVDRGEVFATFNVGITEKSAFDEEKIALIGKHTSAVSQAVQNILLFESQSEAVERLTELHRMKNEFFAEISHDLRHPLTVAMGVLDILETGWDLHEDERKRELVKMAAQNARSVSELLQRDLEIALIESGELRFDIESFDLAELVRETCESFAGATPDRVVDVVIAPGLSEASADRRRQAQILNNLLSNAAKFSPPGSRITIQVAPSDAHLQVSVADEGSGIAPDLAERVFDRLSRLERSAPGSGLGLYITRSMWRRRGVGFRSDPRPARAPSSRTRFQPQPIREPIARS